MSSSESDSNLSSGIQLYQIIDKNIDLARIDKKQLENLRHTFTKMRREYGAEIKGIVHVTRDEPFPNYYENTDYLTKLHIVSL